MTRMKTLCVVLCALVLTACGQPEGASRNLPKPGLTLSTTDSQTKPGPVHVQYDVQKVRINVPSSLRASEANMYYPIADIVWRGEPLGNRHEQVRAIFREAMARGTGTLNRGQKVIVDVQVTRFHCLTEKTRYSVGGVHSLQFLLTVRDAATDAVIDGPRLVIADVKASGGYRAMAEDQAGLTQRVVVVQRLSEVILRELSKAPAAAPKGPGALSSAAPDADLPARL